MVARCADAPANVEHFNNHDWVMYDLMNSLRNMMFRDGVLRVLGSDSLFIFAGGELPSEFLKKIGVRLRTAGFEGRHVECST